MQRLRISIYKILVTGKSFYRKIVMLLRGQPMRSDAVAGERLDLILEAVRPGGLTVDQAEWLSRGLSITALRIFSGNASTCPPQYMKSSGTP